MTNVLHKKERVATIVVSGVICAGKGTNAKFIENCFADKLQKIEFGEIIRQEIYAGTPFGKMVADDVWSGKLLDDKIIYRYVSNRIFLDYSLGKRNSLLDGFPRTPGQVDEFERIVKSQSKITGKEIFPVQIVLNADDELVYSRSEFRAKQAEKNNTPIRLDDTPKVVKARLKEFRDKTEVAIDKLSKKGIPVLLLDANTDLFSADKEKEAALQNARQNEIQQFLQKYELGIAR
jgi:adenylate kinase